MTTCAQIINWSLQIKTMHSRVARREQSAGKLEGTRAQIWGCLLDNGYPGGSCSPTAAQLGCVPAGTSAAFYGTPPACRISFAAD